MNKKHLIMMLFILLTVGCIKEDWSDCNNVTIMFRYSDAGSDPFTDYIEKVNLSVYRADGSFVGTHQIDKASLDRFTGIELNLDPGEYRIVCWGNVLDYTNINNHSTTPFIDGVLKHNTTTPENGDPLFYGPRLSNIDNPDVFKITVSSSGQMTTETIDFGPAHNIIEVSVKGFVDNVSGTTTNLPIIELANLPQGYNFAMQPLTGTMNYSRRAEAATVSGTPIGLAEFNVPQFKNDNPIMILIKNPSDNSTAYYLSLKDFLAKNGITVSPTELNTIRISIEFVDSQIKVTVSDWNTTDVQPGF